MSAVIHAKKHSMIKTLDDWKVAYSTHHSFEDLIHLLLTSMALCCGNALSMWSLPSARSWIRYLQPGCKEKLHLLSHLRCSAEKCTRYSRKPGFMRTSVLAVQHHLQSINLNAIFKDQVITLSEDRPVICRVRQFECLTLAPCVLTSRPLSLKRPSSSVTVSSLYRLQSPCPTASTATSLSASPLRDCTAP